VALARLLQLGQIGCVVDLTGVRFVTSFFLGKLMEWRRKLSLNAEAIVVCGARPEIHELLISTRLSRIITIVDTMEEALRTVRQAAEGPDASPNG
jgi:anti-anti-sigma factor